MTRLVETFDSVLLMEHPGHSNQKVHGHRYAGIAKATAEQGGFSANWIGHAPRSGYMVGGVVKPRHLGSVKEMSREELGSAIKAFSKEHREVLRKPGHYLGTWVDEDDDSVWVDVSQRVATKSGAEKLGGARGEIAVYDVRRGTSFNLTEPAGGQT